MTQSNQLKRVAGTVILCLGTWGGLWLISGSPGHAASLGGQNDRRTTRGLFDDLLKVIAEIRKLTNLSWDRLQHYIGRAKSAKGKDELDSILTDAVNENSAKTPSPVQTNQSQSTVTATVNSGSLGFAKTNSGQTIVPSLQFKTALGRQTTPTSLAVRPAGTQLAIENFLGTGEPWHLSVRLGAFKNLEHPNIAVDGAKLHLNPSSPTSQSTYPAVAYSPELKAGGDAAVILRGKKDGGMGRTQLDLANTQLDWPAVRYAGSYTADLTYTLTTGPVK
ncbi:WxL domain-containing protein [Levilactobacillus suantsaii]|nr:WxL domain-containing protein [Levilactobacillus suantsaii]QMU07682.1 WxL domain-containing protein [Levilactobacillus suantsaii]